MAVKITRLRLFLIVLVTIFVTGCERLTISNANGHLGAEHVETQTPFNAFLDLRGNNAASGDTQQTALDPRSLITREAVEAGDVPLYFVEVPGRGFEMFRQVSAHKEHSYWRALNGTQGFTLTEHGLVVRTIGLGFDLENADQAPTVAVLKSRQPQRGYVKTYRKINGLGRIEAQEFICDFSRSGVETLILAQRSYTTRIFTESCKSEMEMFDNRYWLQGNVLRASEQWISTEIGIIRLERLTD